MPYKNADLFLELGVLLYLGASLECLKVTGMQGIFRAKLCQFSVTLVRKGTLLENHN